MWPISLFGLLALGLALRHAIAPKQALLPLILGLGTATLFAGLLGVTMGIITTIHYAVNNPANHPHLDLPKLVLLGTAESLQCAAFSLVFAVMIALASGIGSYRARDLVDHR
jgi:hypothetical protein